MDYIGKADLIKRFEKITDDTNIKDSVSYLDELINDNETVKFVELECVMKEYGFNLDWDETANVNACSCKKCNGMSIIYTNDDGDRFFLDVGVKLNINLFRLTAKGTYFESGESEKARKLLNEYSDE